MAYLNKPSLEHKNQKGRLLLLLVRFCNSPGTVEGALTLAPDGSGCCNKPYRRPAAVLTE